MKNICKLLKTWEKDWARCYSPQKWWWTIPFAAIHEKPLKIPKNRPRNPKNELGFRGGEEARVSLGFSGEQECFRVERKYIWVDKTRPETQTNPTQKTRKNPDESTRNSHGSTHDSWVDSWYNESTQQRLNNNRTRFRESTHDSHGSTHGLETTYSNSAAYDWNLAHSTS